MSAAQYQPGQVLPGTVYRVVRHLATGGMGSVYDVEDTTVEKRYVLKTLHPNLVTREDLAIRMRDEAKSLAKLQHPNIVDVVTAGVTTDAQKMPFYVMERLIGQNLRVVLEKTSALHLLHAYRIAIDVADALEHAHENNIVHRDVKPENIFLHRNTNGTTTTKLLDFGIVRLLDRKVSHTQGKFIGTLRYASPEQIAGSKVGPTTDIYSLAAVLFEMLCGRGPFDDAGDAFAIGAAHASQPAPPLSQFIRVSREVERLVASGLAKKPEDRPRDCFVFASELRRILREEESGPRSITEVNILSSAPPRTEGEAAPTGTSANGPTEHGMIPPSAASDSLVPHRIPTGPSTRPEKGAPVSPIAPTLAAEGQEAYAGRPSDGRALDARGSGGAARPAAGLAADGVQAIDRNAATRASAPFGETLRLAPNDTQMVSSALASAEERREGASDGRASAPPSHDRRVEGELVFPPLQVQTGTGPISGEASTRPPERGRRTVVAVLGVFAAAIVASALLLRLRAPSEPSPSSVELPRPSIGATPALPATTALAPATGHAVAATATAPTPTTATTPTAPTTPTTSTTAAAKASVTPASPAAEAPATASSAASVSPAAKARPVVSAARAAAQKPKGAPTSASAPTIPFDP